MTSRRTVEPLTPRQKQVLALLADGRTNPEIAERLGISLDGAKWHVREVLARLDVSSREEAGEYWRREHSGWRRLVWAGPLLASSHAKLVVAAIAVVIGLGAVSAAIYSARDHSTDIALSDITNTPVPPATVTPSPADEFAPRSGIAIVDEVVAIVKSGDVRTFRALMKAFPEPCTTKQRGVGSPPACPPGAPEGSMVDTLRALSGERVDMGADMDQLLGNVVPGLTTLHGVALAQTDTFRGLFPAWKYEVVVYGNAGGQQMWGVYLLDDTGIVGVWAPGGGFGASDRAKSIPDADWLIAPISVLRFGGIPGLFVLGRDSEIRFPVNLPPACAGRPFGIKLYGYPPPGVAGGIQELTAPGLDVIARGVADPSGMTTLSFPLPSTASAPVRVRGGLLASCLSGIAVQGQTGLALLATTADRDIAIIEYSGEALDQPGGPAGATLGEFISPLTATVNGTVCAVVDTGNRAIRNARGNVEFRIGTPDQPAACRAPGQEIVFLMPETAGPGIAGKPLFEKPAFVPGAIQLVRNIGPEAISN